jgi:Na+-translocating ferredoxin:NAD+ oxidoreductase RnfG subunit
LAHRTAWLTPIVGLLAAAPAAHATVYLSAEQARAAIFPRATFTESPLTLTPAQVAEIQKRSGQRVLSPRLRAWRASTGGWFLVDQVIGKHEFITFAFGVDAGGAVKGIEILEYRESYGGEVGAAAWRAQFTGKRADAPLKLGADIRNISGATLSSKHITDGVKRLLCTYVVALAPLA